MKKAQFFCEECGTEVRMNASKCPNCGKVFAAVRCPKCSYVGQPGEFVKGCPNCGYSEEAAAGPPPREAGTRSPAKGTEGRPHRPSSRGLSSLFYTIVGFLLLAAVILLIVLYSRIF